MQVFTTRSSCSGVIGCSEEIGGGSDFQNFSHHAGGSFSLERFFPRGHFVHDRAERENIRARVHFLGLNLLRRHILQRPKDRSFARDGVLHRRKLRKRSDRSGFLRQLRQAEVEQLGPRLREHDVAGFQIAVGDALAMRLVQRIGNLDCELQHLLDRQRASLQSLRERLAFDIFHHQKIDVVLVAGIEKRADVRMIQAGDGFRFALEPLAQFRAISEMRGQNFDRDGSIEARIAGFIHFAHSARADRGENFVWP